MKESNLDIRTFLSETNLNFSQEFEEERIYFNYFNATTLQKYKAKQSNAIDCKSIQCDAYYGASPFLG